MKSWIHEKLFIIGHKYKYKDFLKWYDFAKKKEFESYKNLKIYQEEMLKNLIQFSYDYVPYYSNLFKKINVKPEDIQSIEDLQKLPILNKDTIRKKQKDFIPKNLKEQKYIIDSTGGSTGKSFHYRLSLEDRSLCLAINYINWTRAGHKLGDKVAIIAGSALIPSTGSKISTITRELVMNNRFYSSFDLSERYMGQMLSKLNKFKPKYLYGYASSIYLFSKYIKDKDLKIDFKPHAVFTTAEVLFDFQRKTIEDTLNCNVFDQYGLNDGGVSAYECERHNGLHIDMLRSIMEVTDDSGNQLGTDIEGKILATSLHNYAMPFIRYDTEDLGIISDIKCECGRKMPLLKKVTGRVTDYLEFSNGAIIGSPVLTVLLGKFDIIQYQIVQKKADMILIYIIKGETFSNDDEKKIRDVFYKHVGKIDIEFRYVDKIETSKAGKWKFIIRET